MLISVLIATYNGAETIERTLAALARAARGWPQVEIVAVDNRSTDGTPDILRRAVQSMPLTILNEPRPGKSHAINTGLDACRGEIVAFTDDDVIVGVDWLKNIAGAASRVPNLDIFGGPIVPLFEDTEAVKALLPLPRHMMSVLYAQRLRIGPKLVPPNFLFGPNFAVRRRVLDSGLRFDPDVGPDGSKTYRMGNETTFLRSCARRGFRAGFFNRLAVQHIVPPRHTTKAWILGRARRFGYGEAYADAFNPAIAAQLHVRGIPRYQFRNLVRAAMAYRSALLRHDERAWIERWWLVAYLSYYREYRRLRRPRPVRAAA